ncbi:MAG: hypothetical protein HQK51_20575, partial [Oligoflexia bacterium]|nr:hypothetical protein [Oligoflexia bacterium]
LQTLTEKDPSKLKKYLSKGEQLRNEYFERASYWNKKFDNNTNKNNIRSTYLKDSYNSGKEFLSIRDNIFIPAILREDYKTAEKIVLGDMLDKYEKHRIYIDKLIKITNEKNISNEGKATKYINRFSLLLLLVSFLLFISFAIIGYIGYTLIINKINNVTKIQNLEQQEVIECLSSMKSMLETENNTSKYPDK